jgi:molybdate transport system ATP-binding protein
MVVIGPNGAGKTSLLTLLLGAHPVERGRIELDGLTLLDTERGIEVPLERRQLGYLPQDYALFPHLSVRANIEFALGSRSAPDPARVTALLREFGLEALAERKPAALSGGEKQRVGLARALSTSPRALLLDEPLAALDVHVRGEVRQLLRTHLERSGLPCVLVTHDADDARALGQRVVALEAGRVTQSGTWEELAEAPASRFVQAFTKYSSKT